MTLQSLRLGWSKLTAPHASITNIERRRQSRLLANFVLVIMLFQLITFSLAIGGNIRPEGIRNAIVALMVSMIVYLLNRSGHYRIAAYILVVITFITSHLSLITESHANIYYIAGVILVSAMLVSWSTTIGLFILSVILQFIFVINAPKTFTLQSFQPLIFTILISTIVLVFIHHRVGLERERQAELRRTIAALQKSEARWRSLVENAPDYILELDTDYRICYTNRTQANISPETLVGRLVFDFIPPEDIVKAKETLAATIQLHKTMSYEGVSYSLDGAAAWYSTTVSPIIREGQLDGVMLISRDVSEHVQAEQQRLDLSLAAERVQLLTELIADLSHDLKSPLTVINTSLYILEKLDDPQKQKDKLEQIKRQVLRLEKLIQDILTLSTLEKAPQLNLTSLNLNQLASEIEKQFFSVAASKGLSLKFDLHRNLASVQGDEEALRRALINLVENALNYTPAPGEVMMRTDQSADTIILEVRDTGIGIATEDLPRVFDRFYRTGKARQTMTGGTGLGLAIVKKTIEMHSGRIDVSSQPDRGTTFRISLPLSL
jgi:PAS domain S-box-containing protein